jgi:hypothetical protein
MNVRLIAAISFTALAMIAHAQEKSADTVIIPLAKTSKIIFIMQDRSDLEVLKHYNFQDMFTDVFKKLKIQILPGVTQQHPSLWQPMKTRKTGVLRMIVTMKARMMKSGKKEKTASAVRGNLQMLTLA